MNCNRCGTPILPGENACRFCGTVGEYSKRTYEEPKPEIIDFTTGEDDVSIVDQPKKEEVSNIPNNIENKIQTNPVVAPVAPVSTPTSVGTTNTVLSVKEAPVIAKPVVPVTPATNVAPVTTPITAAPVPQVVKPAVSAEKVAESSVQPVVTKITDVPTPVVSKQPEPVVQPTPEAKEEKIVTPVASVVTPVPSSTPSVATPVKEIVQTVSTSENVTPVSAATPIVVTDTTTKEKEEVISEVVTTNDVTKEKKNHGLFNILTFILIILLILSIILNCFLLMGSGSNNGTEDDTTVVSSTKQAIYFNSYKVEVPSNWITVTSNDNAYVTLMDNSEDWALSIDVATNVDSTIISSDSSKKAITSAFGEKKYLFTSDYDKTVDGKNFYIFKGKYSDYTVYVITCGLDSTNTVVADLKFKGEVDEDILSNVLSSLSTVSNKSLTSFYSNDFTFDDITSLISDNVVIDNAGINEEEN